MKLLHIQTLHTTAQIVKPYDPSTMPATAESSSSAASYLPYAGIALVVIFFGCFGLLARRRRKKHYRR